jgi:predicted acyl esterase
MIDEKQGYAYVHADVRGSGISGGEFGAVSTFVAL